MTVPCVGCATIETSLTESGRAVVLPAPPSQRRTAMAEPKLETTAQDREHWQIRADDAGRLARDFATLTRELAEARAIMVRERRDAETLLRKGEARISELMTSAEQ